MPVPDSPGILRRPQATDRSRLYAPATARLAASTGAMLGGGDVLPGFSLSIRDRFAEVRRVRRPVKNRAWFKTSPSWVVLESSHPDGKTRGKNSAENRQKVAENGAFFEGLIAPFRPARSRSRWSKLFICGTLCRWGPARASRQKTRQSAGGAIFASSAAPTDDRGVADSSFILHPSSFILHLVREADPHRSVMPSPNREARQGGENSVDSVDSVASCQPSAPIGWSSNARIDLSSGVPVMVMNRSRERSNSTIMPTMRS